MGAPIQINYPIHSIAEIHGCKNYIDASLTRKNNETMAIKFPDIAEKCPLCTRKSCAIWKGYYFRMLECWILGFMGQVCIRKGLCKSTGRHFTMFPDFCIPYLKWGKLSILKLLELFIKSTKSYFSTFEFDLDFDISISSLYWIGSYLVQVLRLNAELFLLPNNRETSTNSVFELRKYSLEATKKVILSSYFQWSKRIIRSGNSPPI